MPNSQAVREPTGLEVAIVGASVRFPGASDLDGFWRLLRDGTEAISFFSAEETRASTLDPIPADDPQHVRAAGVVVGIEDFDAAFFSMSPREAEATDPQHRLFLECAWEAIETAGYAPDLYAGRIGVYASAGTNTYLLNNLCANRTFLGMSNALQMIIGNDKDYLATRVSYKLNLRGPSLMVQTACSSSLVAVHTACQALLDGDCDMALAGGASINVPQTAGYRYQDGSIGSPDGHCRPFDADACGTVKSSGAGIVLLKRLEEALADGDTILAVIRGSAVNNDGSAKVSFSAPSAEGQAEAIEAALRVSEVDPESIAYIEAHGTGTRVGDPIEFVALERAFRARRSDAGTCAIGSVKSNLGHLDAAAGVAGLIKTALALQHREIPPSLHYRRPNPNIDFAVTPFRVAAALEPWPDQTGPHCAGVSSFGIGGTNCHVVLEEPPCVAQTDVTSGRPQLLLLSACTRTALDRMSDRLATRLDGATDETLADAAYTLQVGRNAFPWRRALVATSAGEAVASLRGGARTDVVLAGAPRPKIALLLPGQGTQRPGMGARLYEDDPRFHALVDDCAARFAPLVDFDLRGVFRPKAENDRVTGDALARTSIAQPALFTIEYAMALLLKERRIPPDAMIGHSLGELVAACLAGVFSLEDAVWIVAARGRLMQTCPPGAMTAVRLSEAEVASRLPPDLSLAAVNGTAMCVVSGSLAAIERFEGDCRALGVQTQRLPVSHGFHSLLMEPMLPAFRDALMPVRLRAPTVPFISNVTGRFITDAEATDPEYWIRQIRAPVRFHEGLSALIANESWALVETGPGDVLSRLAKPCALGRPGVSIHCCLGERDDDTALLCTVGQLWCRGVEIDRARLSPEPRRRIPLPTYPFEKKRFWIDPEAPTGEGPARFVPAPSPADLAASHRADDDIASLDSNPAAPMTATELFVARLWREALGVETIGPHDDFFALGGDSILGLQVTFRARQAGVGFSPAQLLQHSTVVALAREIERAGDAGDRDEGAPARLSVSVDLPEIVSDPSTLHEPFPLTDVQQAYWIGRSGLAGGGPIAAHVYQEYEGKGLDLARLESALDRLISRHDALRSITTPDGRQRILAKVPRYETALAQALGPFEEYAPMVVAASDDTSFVELLRRADIDGTVSNGPPSSLKPHRQSGVGFSFVDLPDRMFGRSAAFELRDVEARSEGFKLELDCRRLCNAFRVDVCYDSSVYDASVATSLRDALVAVIDHVEMDGDTALGALPLVTSASRNRVQAPIARPAPPTTFVEIFDHQVARLPAAIAVQCGAAALTYAELDDRATRLARRLIIAGVAPGHVVGVMLARSVEAIVGVLAVLKCGATFLPLDTGLPTGRLAFFLLQATASRLLTTRDLVRPELLEGRSAIYYDEGAGAAELADIDLPTIEPAEAAYIVFTSGSTGEPKGVVVEHRQLMDYVRAAITDLELEGMGSFATVSTLAADLGHTAIFPALATGAVLHVIPQEVAADASQLAAYFARHEVDVLKIVPSHFAAVVAGLPDPSLIFPRRRLILGGETITLGMMRVFRSYAGECRVFNHYGPTETTVGVVAGDTERTMASVFCKSVPLGAPLASAAVHILDAGLGPVPNGVTAEIFVGGTSLARGYAGRPDLTADRFLPDPLSGQAGHRIYRTGDLGRRLPDGSIEWMGRVDRQVKIRGFRVELTEIEALLSLCPGVRQAVVSLNGEVEYQRIIAYVVRSDATIASVPDMQASLAEKLPDYMLPAAILFLDDIPLTSNGKIDYRALPDPDRYAAVADRPIAEPRTLAEHLVATIFMALLGTASVGIHDDFFEIGGHSLLATRLLAKLRSVFGIDMSLRAIFEGSSIAALAVAAEEGDHVTDGIESEASPTSPGLQDAFAADPGRVRGLSLWLNGPLDDGVLRSAIAECVERHDLLRSCVVGAVDTEESRRSGDERHIDLVVRAASPEPENDVDELAAVSWARALSGPFPRDAGVLWRFGILHLSGNRHLFQIVADSSIADATSLELFVEDVASCLEPSGRVGDTLPEPSTPFAATRFAKAGDDRTSASIAYWRRHLGCLSDRPKALPEGSTSADPPIIVPIERAEVAEFERLARRFLTTLPLLFLAAWSAAVAEETNRDDVLVLVARTGRPRSDELGCVGPFPEAYPLRLQWGDEKPFVDLLDETRIAAVRATLHHSLGLQTILLQLDGADVDFDAGFSFAEPPKIAKLGGATVERMTPIDDDHDARAAAVLRIVATADGLEYRVETHGVACRSTALARRWRSVLDRVAQDGVVSSEIEHA